MIATLKDMEPIHESRCVESILVSRCTYYKGSFGYFGLDPGWE